MRSDQSVRAMKSPTKNDKNLRDINDGSQYMNFGNISEPFGDQSEYLSQYLVSGSMHPSETASAGQEPRWDHEPPLNPHLDPGMMLDGTNIPGWYHNSDVMEEHIPAPLSQLDTTVSNFTRPEMLHHHENFSPGAFTNLGRGINTTGFMDGQAFVNNVDHHSTDMTALGLGDGDQAFPEQFRHSPRNNAPLNDADMPIFANKGNSIMSNDNDTPHREYSDTTLTSNGPLVPSMHNDDFEVDVSKSGGYFVTENSVMQTPIRGGHHTNVLESQDNTPFTERHSLQGSPTYFMHGLQSPMDSASLQSPNVPFPNYVPGAGNMMVSRSNSMRRLHPMISSPRVQRSMSSASQMNSPSLGDIAEAPGEASPQTPGVRNRTRAQPPRSLNGSMATSRQLTPKSTAVSSGLTPTYMIGGMDMNSDMDSRTHYIQPGSLSVSAAAAAAASMGFSPKKNASASADKSNPTKRMSAGSASSASPTRTKRESRRRVTQDQIDHLEKAFSENPRPGPADRDRLAETIKLDVREVASWFHKRRLKDRAQASATEGPLKPGKQKGDRSGKTNGGQSADACAKDGDASQSSRTAGTAKVTPPQVTRPGSNGPSQVAGADELGPPLANGDPARLTATNQMNGTVRGYHSNAAPLPANKSIGGHLSDMYIPPPMVFGNNPADCGPPAWENSQTGPLGMHRHMSTSNLPNNASVKSIHPSVHTNIDATNQRPRPGLYRSSSYGYHQQLNPNGVPYPPPSTTDMRPSGSDVNDSHSYRTVAQQFPAYNTVDGNYAAEYSTNQPNGRLEPMMGPYDGSMGPMPMGPMPMGSMASGAIMNGGRPVQPRIGSAVAAYNGSGKTSPNQPNRSKRRSAHMRGSSNTSNVNSNPEPFMRLSSGSGMSDHSSSSSSSSNGPYGPPRQRSMSNYDSLENIKFNNVYSGSVTPFGPASRSNSIASVNSLSMYPPNVDSMESRQGSPESQSAMRWPPYSNLSRSHSMVAMNPMDPGAPQYPGDMKRRRSLYGTPLPVQVRGLDESTGANQTPTQMIGGAGSLASSAAAAALRASNRRNSSGPATRSRQSSFRLQLEEDNHAAHLVIYNNNDPKNQSRSQNSATEGNQSRLNFPANSESHSANQQISLPEFNVNQAIQRLSSLRQHSPQRHSHGTWNDRRES